MLARKTKKTIKFFFFCVNKANSNCTATAIVCTKTSSVVALNKEHNHDSDLLKERVRDLEEVIISQAATTMEKPRNVVGKYLIFL